MVCTLATDSVSQAATAAVNSITWEEKLPDDDLKWLRDTYGTFTGTESWHATASRMLRRFIRQFPAHFPEGEAGLSSDIVGILQRMQSDYMHYVLSNYSGAILGVFDGAVIEAGVENERRYGEISKAALEVVASNYLLSRY